MRKHLFALTSCLITVILLASCTTLSQETRIIKMKMAPESVAIRDAMLEGYDKDSFNEENFPYALEALYQADMSQDLPEYEFKNKVEIDKSFGNDVCIVGADEYKNIVLYVHGGAWVYGITAEHLEFCDRLADTLKAKVYMPLYPLAPYSDYEATYDYLDDIYDSLLSQKKPIFLFGDSAGGNIALSFSVQLKTAGKKLPNKLVLLSPCVDMSMSNPQMENYEEKDPMLVTYGCRECAKLWAGDTLLSDTRLSPLYADLTGLEDTLLFIATDGILYPDAMLFRDKMVASKCDILTVVGKEFWHVFPLTMGRSPDEQKALRIIKSFCL